MKTKTSFTLHGCLLAAAILFQPLSAQQASVDENNNEAKEKELVVLSPFEVNADKDTGYQATSTLAGTRLNTPIKDLAASISIYTKDFLNDLSLTNTSDLLVYATGMEAAGANGNFSGAASDISSERPTVRCWPSTTSC